MFLIIFQLKDFLDDWELQITFTDAIQEGNEK